MKKAKLKRDTKPQKKGFFEQKHIDIYRHGDMLVFKDTSDWSEKQEGEYVDNLRFICFEDSKGTTAMLDIEKGKTSCYHPYTTLPIEDDQRILLQEARYDDYNTPLPRLVSIPYVEENVVITKESLAYFTEDIAE